MMPVYRYMDSYPVHGNQMSSAPSVEAVPPLARVDPSKSVVINQPWFYPNNFGYSAPCYPCSSHGNFPGYYSHGPWPHFSSPQFHCCGQHPPFPDAFPGHYVPPPYYLKELPRYDYDKPRDSVYHCCGCPHNTHNQKNGDGVRVEEQEPNVESKMGQSLAPIQLENYPYPVLWIPSEYMKDKEHRKHLESDGANWEKASQDMKPAQNVKPNEQTPRERPSWLPLDIKSLQSLLQDDDGSRTRDQQEESKMRQFPFPIIWMPPHYKQREAEKEEQGKMIAAPRLVKDPASSNNVFPVKLLNSGDGMNKPQEIHENAGGQVDSELMGNNANQRSIPVKQMEVSKEKENSEDVERRGRAVSPRKGEKNATDKASGANAKRESSSSPKSSKLPPICLRVDPLPRKKSSNVSSRSPSPPVIKGKLQETTRDAPKVSDSSEQKEQNQQDSQVEENTVSSNKGAEENKNMEKVIQVVERKTNELKGEKQRNDSETKKIPISSSFESGDKTLSNQTTQESGKNDVKYTVKADEGLENADELIIKQANENVDTNNAGGCSVAETRGEKKLSDDEVALRIQSAYRGYQVRKWEPLKKLKQIAQVREQLVEIRKMIDGLESSPDLQKDEKQKIVLGEMIMSLLLKLDTIQGLHPSLRDIRKSLAKELVALQEKLDLLSKTKSSEKPSTDPSSKIGTEEGVLRDSGEHPTDDAYHRIYVVSRTQDNGTSDPPLSVKEERREIEHNVPLVTEDVEFSADETKVDVLKEEFHSGTVPDERTSQLPSEKSSLDEMVGAQLESISCDPKSEGQSELSEASGSMYIDNNSQVRNLEDLPRGVTANELATSAEEQMGTSIGGGEQNEEVDSSISESTSSAAVVDESNIAVQVPEINLLHELPVGVIDTDESLKHEQAGLLENVLLPGGDVEEKAATDTSEQQPIEVHSRGQKTIDTSSQVEDAPDLNESEQLSMLVHNEKPTGTDTSSPDKEALIQNNMEQQPVEMFDKGSSVVEPKDEMKVGTEMSGNCSVKIMPGDVQQSQAFEVNNYDRVDGSQLEEIQEASFLLQKKDDDDEVQEENLEGSILEVTPNVVVSEGDEAQIGDFHDNVDQPTGEDVKEGIIQEQEEYQELESVNGSNIVAYQPDRSETTKRESVGGAQPTSMLTEHHDEKRASLPVSSAASQPHIEDLGVATEDGRKLVEENEKMREMVKKLIESGKEQLAVISNLTGRVKDLEKQLRRKKMRARRYRTPISSPPYKTPSIKSPRMGAVSAAM